MLVPPEDGGAFLRVVTADALEDTRAVVEAVGENVNLGVVPVDELTVHPDGVDVAGRPHLVETHLTHPPKRAVRFPSESRR
jgi:hypothetical protein